MSKKCLIAVAALAGLLAATTDAHATFFTSNADIQIEATAGGGAANANDPPIVNIKTLTGSGGWVFTNQVSGTPFAVGSEVRTVTVQILDRGLNGTVSPIEFYPEGTDPFQRVVVFTALRGTVKVGGTNPIVEFVQGRAFVGSEDSDDFDVDDPSTWSFNPIAQYDLAAPETVVQGPAGAPVGVVPSSIVNLSGLNAVVPGQPSGVFLFAEASTDAQNALAIGDADNNDANNPDANTGGDNFIFNVDPIPALLFGPNAPAYEGLFVEVFQSVQNVAPGGTLDAGGVDLGILNEIAAAAGLDDLGGANTGFATGLGAGDNEFGGGGDFEATISTEANIGISNLPEPSSLALLGIAGAAFGLYSRRQRRGQVTQKDS